MQSHRTRLFGGFGIVVVGCVVEGRGARGMATVPVPVKCLSSQVMPMTRSAHQYGGGCLCGSCTSAPLLLLQDRCAGMRLASL